MMHSLLKSVVRIVIAQVMLVTSTAPAMTPDRRADWKAPQSKVQVQIGKASWYGPGFHGKRSADGSIFDQYDLTAAHRTLPFGTYVHVRNLENGAMVKVRITDRGPYAGGRVLDLSKAAAQRLKMTDSGVALVQIVTSTPKRIN